MGAWEQDPPRPFIRLLIVVFAVAGRAFSQGEAASQTIHFAGGTSTFHVDEAIVKSDARLNLQFRRRVMRPAGSSGSIRQ